MPELPEVETIRRGLDRICSPRSFGKVLLVHRFRTQIGYPLQVVMPVRIPQKIP